MRTIFAPFIKEGEPEPREVQIPTAIKRTDSKEGLIWEFTLMPIDVNQAFKESVLTEEKSHEILEVIETKEQVVEGEIQEEAAMLEVEQEKAEHGRETELPDSLSPIQSIISEFIRNPSASELQDVIDTLASQVFLFTRIIYNYSLRAPTWISVNILLENLRVNFQTFRY